jgi:hypothetical protein
MRFFGILAGCLGPPIIVAGQPMAASYWTQNDRDVRQRAAFELSCPSEQLQLVPLMTKELEQGQQVAHQIGVTGCGHRLVYVLDYSGGWVLNSSDAAPR